MAKEEAKGARRLLDLDIREVSLVDRAANLRRFLVIKRLEDETMRTFELDVEEVTKGAETEGAQVHAILKAMLEMEEAPQNELNTILEFIDKAEKAKPKEDEDTMKSVPADLASAIKDVVAWMKKMSKGPGAPSDAISRVAAFLGKVAGGKYPYPSPKAKAKPKEDEEEGKKGTKAKAKPDEDEDMYPSPKSQSKKDEDGGASGLSIRLTAEGDVLISGQTVHKSKQFTGPRTAALKDTILGLLKLVAEVDPAATKEIQDFAKELPTDPNFPSGVRPTGTSGVKKSETEEKILDQLTKLEKRLEKIETERPASQSLENQGGTDNQVKKSKSIWDGVI